MLLIGIVLGLVLGLALGGRFDNLVFVRLRWAAFIFIALMIRLGTEFALRGGVELANTLRLPLFMAAFGALIYGLWLNRDKPGLLVVAAGAASNAIAIAVNGGYMPVYGPALAAVGLALPDLNPSFHQLLPEGLGPEFLLRAGPLADVLPIPLPLLNNVASIGDVFISAGLGWFVFATLVRGTANVDAGRVAAEGMGPGVATANLERPMLLGGAGQGPTIAAGAGLAAPARRRGPLPSVLARAAGHPYTRLALDARFSAFWLGQTISLFGDRLHQVALGVLVYGQTNSALLTGLVFLSASLPNLVLGPIAGTFVDRWDHKRVMVASDFLRAALVLFIPLTAAQNLFLVYPLVFLITTVSIFFRPAKSAVLPRIVREDHLMAANSATWTGETIADIGGYPLAALLVAFLGPAIALAFTFDAVTYVVSGLLIASLVIPPVVRDASDAAVDAAPGIGGAVRAFFAEVREGWAFLRGQAALYQNTLISAVAQTSVGATLAITIVYARDQLDPTLIPYPQNYGALEAAVGVGNLIGGIAVGAMGTRLRKGPLIAGGFIVMGAGTVVLGLTGNVIVALVALGLVGIANLVYVIPTQTLFAERTPITLMGRVVAFRSSLVFGAMTLAMAIASGLADTVGPGLVIAGFGAVTLVSGVVAAMLPAIRDS